MEVIKKLEDFLTLFVLKELYRYKLVDEDEYKRKLFSISRDMGIRFKDPNPEKIYNNEVHNVNKNKIK